MKMSAAMLVLALLTVSAPVVSAEVPAGDLPEVVMQGLEGYMRADAETALKAWVAGGPLDSDEFVAAQASGLHRIEEFYGKYKGYEPIRVAAITPRLKAVYLAMYFEKGAAFCYMLCFKSDGGRWIVSDFDGSTTPRRILPEYGAVAAPMASGPGAGGNG